MNLSTYRFVYFLGAGGIGMSAIARWFNVNGFEVAGYDKTETKLTQALENEGINIHFEDDIQKIPPHFLENPSQTLVVLTPAIPKNHTEWNHLIAQGFTILKRSEVLGLLTSRMFTIGVAGTHGKTTTSSMIAHVLKASGKNVTAFLGGITQNYQSNFLLNDQTDKLEEVICVVEADEFDRSFLTLFPDIAVVTSTDADHLDIYGQHSQLLESFEMYVSQIKPNGVFFKRQGINIGQSLSIKTLDYAFESGDYHTQNFRIENATFVFDIVYPKGILKDVVLQMPGFHNAENALAAFACALAVGVLPQDIKTALGSYKGVKRRFEYHLKSDKYTQIDDYAHHPTEISAFLTSVRALYPNRHITAIFQPHLFTRTRDFQEGFSESLSLADRLILMDIYPARELPIEGISSEIILKDVNISDKTICPAPDVLALLAGLDLDIVCTIGAGDIDQLVGPITELLVQKNIVLL